MEIGLWEKYNWHSMRLKAHSFPISKAHQGLQVKGQHTGARLAGHLNEIVDRFHLRDACLIGITTDNASSNYSMICELHTTFEAPRIEWPAFRNHIPCMAHVIQLASGAFMSTLGVKGPPSYRKPMSAISNLNRMKAQTLGRVKDFEKRAMLESTRYRP